MKKFFRTGGLWLFILGFAVFVISLTVGQFRLTREIITRLGEGEKYQSFSIASEDMQGITYTSNIAFVHDVNEAIKNCNEFIIKKYSISIELADKLAAASKDGKVFIFKTELIDQVLSPKNEVTKSQNLDLKNYTSWMEGKSFDTQAALAEQLLNSIQSINGSLFYRKAFDSYNSKNLVFSITKDSSLGLLKGNIKWWFILSFGLMIIGAFIYFYGTYAQVPAGIKNNQIFMDAISSKGWISVALGTFMIAFYIFLYFCPDNLIGIVSVLQ